MLGTELYDPERGGFVDLSILDVLQIFGRAGRPQYDTTGNLTILHYPPTQIFFVGHAILITTQKSLANYLGMLTQQAPIESGLIKSLADHLNAEIVNGTVTNIKEAATWLSYTFLFVRMCKNPLVYGLQFDDIFSDPRYFPYIRMTFSVFMYDISKDWIARDWSWLQPRRIPWMPV